MVGISFVSEDVEFIIVDNGNVVVECVCELCSDVVLVDVVMLGLNGYEVCEVFGVDFDFWYILVLLLIGIFEFFDEECVVWCGVVGYVVKFFEV